ncbi:MAG: GNAT family N-acetyltransferase [Thiocapsa sp.]|nr:GNAT family N-acetyltransferase [Thiocapsa sp.]MCG6984616.1 GNAT family N-acetyltransferase [Thiocapsa sp.]
MSEYVLEQLAQQWRLLESGEQVPFSLSWCWMGSWLSLVQRKTKVFVFECRNGPDVVGLCFLTLCPATRLKGHLSFMQLQLNEYLADGCDMAMAYNGLLCESRYLEGAWECFFRTAMEWNKVWDEISLRALSEDQYRVAARQSAKLRFETDRIDKTWRLEFDASFPSLEALIGSFKRKSRQQLRQTLAAYSELGALTITAAASVDEALELFLKMEALHTQRWEKVGKEGSYANPHWVAFHTNLIKSCFGTGQVQALEICVAGNPIGYLYGHVYNRTVYMHQTGFAQTDSTKFRPGYISHCLAMLLNLERGNMTYDFLPDTQDSYKRFFVSEGADVFWVRAVRPRLKFLYEKGVRKSVSALQSAVSRYRGRSFWGKSVQQVVPANALRGLGSDRCT